MRSTIALLTLLAVSAATASHAQCLPPRVTLPSVVCPVGTTCRLPISLDAPDHDIAGLLIEVEPQGPAVITGTAPGPCLNTGEAFYSAIGPFLGAITFDLADPFCNGEVIAAEFECTANGLIDIDVPWLELGGTDGLPVAGCAVGGVIDCDATATTTTTLPLAYDHTCDGLVDLADAVTAVRCVIGGACPVCD